MLPVIDDLHTASYGWQDGAKSARFIEMLRSLKPGVTMVTSMMLGQFRQNPLTRREFLSVIGNPGSSLDH